MALMIFINAIANKKLNKEWRQTQMHNKILKLALENAETKRDVCKQYVTTAHKGSKVYNKYIALLKEYDNIIITINKQLRGV